MAPCALSSTCKGTHHCMVSPARSAFVTNWCWVLHARQDSCSAVAEIRRIETHGDLEAVLFAEVPGAHCARVTLASQAERQLQPEFRVLRERECGNLMCVPPARRTGPRAQREGLPWNPPGLRRSRAGCHWDRRHCARPHRHERWEPGTRAACRRHRPATETTPASLHQLPLLSCLRARQPGRESQEHLQALCLPQKKKMTAGSRQTTRVPPTY